MNEEIKNKLNKMSNELVEYQLKRAKEMLEEENQKEIFVVFFKSFLESHSSTIQSFKSFSELYKNINVYCSAKGLSIEIFIVTKDGAELFLDKPAKRDYFSFCKPYAENEETLDTIFKNFTV